MSGAGSHFSPSPSPSHEVPAVWPRGDARSASRQSLGLTWGFWERAWQGKSLAGFLGGAGPARDAGEGGRVSSPRNLPDQARVTGNTRPHQASTWVCCAPRVGAKISRCLAGRTLGGGQPRPGLCGLAHPSTQFPGCPGRSTPSGTPLSFALPLPDFPSGALGHRGCWASALETRPLGFARVSRKTSWASSLTPEEEVGWGGGPGASGASDVRLAALTSDSERHRQHLHLICTFKQVMIGSL